MEKCLHNMKGVLLVLVAYRSAHCISAFSIVGQQASSQDSFSLTKLSNPARDPLSCLYSTPFDASLYDNEDDLNPFASALSPLALPPSTNIVLGLNKYSHDTSICAADASTGQVYFAMSKERLSRKKHDGGNIASLVELCLDQLELELDSVKKVVVNNHHHRVLPIERNLDKVEWEVGMGINGGSEGGYSDEENLLHFAEQLEISHHLAHAYSASCQSPFESGMVVVMDGMGETYRTMRAALESNDSRYVSDLSFEGQYDCIPSDIIERSEKSVFDWREAESVYEFKKTTEGIQVKVRSLSL